LITTTLGWALGLPSSGGVVDSVATGVESVVVAIGSVDGVSVAVEAASDVRVAGTIVAVELGKDNPAGGVISSASEQALRVRERRITKIIKRNFMNVPFRLRDNHPKLLHNEVEQISENFIIISM